MTIWFYSDPHFDHEELLRGRPNKPPSRRQFATTEEMGEFIVQEHNKLVKPSDHSYCLGDVAMKKTAVAKWMPRLSGHQRLILGNHDIFETEFYLKFFDRVMAYRVFDAINILFSHMPVAPWSAARFGANVHGHTHEAQPLLYSGADPTVTGFSKAIQYVNISMEHTHYRPVSLEEIQSWIKR